MHGITPSIFVGNLEDAKHPPEHIAGVLFVAGEYDIAPQDGLMFKKVPLIEFAEADPRHLHDAVEWLEDHIAGNRVLVCCRAGMGRSVSVVITYLCCVNGLDYVQAVEFLKARRPGATPLPNLESTITKVKELRTAGD